MRQVRVVHVATVDIVLRYLLLNQLRFLQDMGYNVTTISAPGSHVQALEAVGIRHIPVPMTRRLFTPVQDIRAFLRLYGLFRRGHFVIVHAHNPKPGIIGPLAARLAKVPVVVRTLHGFYFDDRTPRFARWFYISLEKLAARFSDLVLSQSREDVETAISESICPAQKITYLGVGIDVEEFSRNRMSPDVLAQKRQELGLPPGAPVVGFVGRLVREKGLSELMSAARAARRHVPDARYIVVGPIDAEKPDAVTTDVARKYGVDDIVHFLGMRQDMPELYALMDVFALPSHREGFPRAPMEAMAMGVPCIVTNIRGCREVVEEGRSGLLVPPRDSDALARAIISLLKDPKRARAMGEEGRRVAAQRFDERQGFNRLASAYARLLREKRLV